MRAQATLGRGIELLQQGKDEEAKVHFAAASALAPSIGTRIDKAWASEHFERSKRLLAQSAAEKAKSLFASAMAVDETMRGPVAEAYVTRGKEL